jgi:FtsH-binding integral membrane protein
MNENISWIDYIKKKYKIEHLEEYISLFFLSLLGSIIIYISFQFPIFHTAILIFVVLLFSMYLIHQYYEIQYQQKIEFIQSKLITIREQLKEVLPSP